jgi:hypothetical protein
VSIRNGSVDWIVGGEMMIVCLPCHPSLVPPNDLPKRVTTVAAPRWILSEDAMWIVWWIGFGSNVVVVPPHSSNHVAKWVLLHLEEEDHIVVSAAVVGLLP